MFFIYFIYFIAGIISLIYFIKMWQMTNNVKAIKNAILDPNAKGDNASYILARAIASNDPNLERILFDKMFYELANPVVSVDKNVTIHQKASQPDPGENFQKILEKYKGLYSFAGVQFPKMFEAIDIAKFNELLNTCK